MSIETIAGAVVALLAMIVGAFGLGHVRGSGKADEKAARQRTEESAAARVAVAERRTEVMRGASEVQQTVNHMPDGDVDRELREQWIRKG
ncbi:hypothetical protein [uncultured Pluralibacter sp.]|uniref:hypothetical protein n=1 Tax=uncultured Pluralibacter sp. TaxID=1490864 RepID=UPI00261E87A7|nr:hypothetical protein [uncultured Pluralibacter sp.]